VPAPTSNNANNSSSNGKFSSGRAGSEDSSSGGGIKAPKPVTSLSKRSLKRARKLGLLTDEDIASAKQSKRSKPNNSLSDAVDTKLLAGGSGAASGGISNSNSGDGDGETGDGSGPLRSATKSNKKVAMEATSASGTAPGSTAASGTAATVASAAPVRAQILAGQSLLEQDLRFVTATRKLGRGLQDGCVVMAVVVVVVVVINCWWLL